MISTGAFWATLAKNIREARRVAAEELAQGNFGDHVQAMRLVGQIAGFDWVMGEADRILGDTKQQSITQTADEDEY